MSSRTVWRRTATAAALSGACFLALPVAAAQPPSAVDSGSRIVDQANVLGDTSGLTRSINELGKEHHITLTVVFAVYVVALLASRRPKLTGSLEVTDGERIVGEVLLDDRSSSLQALFGSAIPGLTGTVRPARRGSGVRLVAKLDGGQVRQQLGDQESVAIGPLTVRYS